jgi:hypothetical protein
MAETRSAMWKDDGKLFLVFFGKMLGVLLFEFLDAAGGIHQLLFAGEKRMAGGTDFYMDFLADGAQLKLAAARAFRRDFMIRWMDIWFHGAIASEERIFTQYRYVN